MRTWIVAHHRMNVVGDVLDRALSGLWCYASE
jgi:hypothetical protein